MHQINVFFRLDAKSISVLVWDIWYRKRWHYQPKLAGKKQNKEAKNGMAKKTCFKLTQPNARRYPHDCLIAGDKISYIWYQQITFWHPTNTLLKSFQKWIHRDPKMTLWSQICRILCHQCQDSQLGTPSLGLSQFKSGLLAMPNFCHSVAFLAMPILVSGPIYSAPNHMTQK